MSSGYHNFSSFPQVLHMKPLNPRNPPLPFTLSDAPSSVVFFSLGLSLMFCAPPGFHKVSKANHPVRQVCSRQGNSPRP